MVYFDGSRQGVTITTDKGSVTTSNLFIPDVTVQDSGVYICAPQGMKEASVRVSVLNGEFPVSFASLPLSLYLITYT